MPGVSVYSNQTAQSSRFVVSSTLTTKGLLHVNLIGTGKNRLVAVALVGMVGLFGAGCDRSSDPVEEYHFLGITTTDGDGAVVGNPDADDWCVSTVGPGNVPYQNALWPAYANPASRSVVIKYGLAEEDSVEIYILAWPDIKVRQIVNGVRSAGTYELTWNLRKDNDSLLAPDIYRCVMKTGDFICHGDIQIIATP